MTDKMAPSLLQIPEIVQNPNRVVIVMTGIDNHLRTDPTQDLTIYVARLRALLNEHARDRVAFVEKRQTLSNLQNQELGNPDPFEESSRGAAAPSGRLVPQYALKGEFYDMGGPANTYYLCTFQLTNLRTGEQVWEGSYEVKTLN